VLHTTATTNQINKIPFPEEWGWQELTGFGHRTSITGFESAAYVSEDGTEVVITYAGTYGNLD
jgi:hypothetical protein